MIKTRTILACILTACSLPALAANAPYRVAPPPGWVSVAPDSLVTAQARPVEAGDSDFALVDYQVRLQATTLRYSRFAERLVSQAAVDAAAQISIEIDPEHEHLSMHQVRVFRDGKVIDKLADARRSLLNRESGLEEGLINGRVTLHLLLKDVRVGDVLDYSFTSERRDPISERGYYEWFRTQWTTPVRNFRLRVSRPAARALYIKDVGQVGEPVVTQAAEWIQTTWEARDIAALREEAARPAWHIRYPRIELSEFADWNAVRSWALPMYEVDEHLDAALNAQVAELRKEPDEARRIVRALRFVQDEIRYTGLEIGAGAYRPAQPAMVLARRYGDCKDKVLLLVTLLRAVDVDAWPVLAHSRFGRALLERLPGPGAFDHVIAKVRSGGVDYWLDATRSGTGGSLQTLVQADFGPALVLAPTRDGLEQMPERTASAPTRVVTEHYDFRAGTGNTAQLTVHTVYRDEDADAMRVRMRTQTVKRLGDDYLEYYRKSHNGIRATKPLVVADDREKNTYTLDESYEIPEPFEKDDDGRRTFNMEAYLISEQTGKPDQTERDSPLARAFPQHVHHEIVAYLPGEWNIEDKNLAVDDPAFRYRSSMRFKAGTLELSYDLNNTRDHVPVTALKPFLTRLDKAHDDAFFELYEEDRPGAAAPIPTVNLRLYGALVVGLALGAACWFFSRRLRWRLPAAEEHAPKGIAGWMILPVLSCVITPFKLAFVVLTWFRNVGDPANFYPLAASVQGLMLLEFVLVNAMLVLAALALWTLVKQDRRFPLVFITILALSSTASALDTIALGLMGESVRKDFDSNLRITIVSLFSSSLWIAYMLVSQRVRATFVGGGGDDYHSQRVPRVIGDPAA